VAIRQINLVIDKVTEGTHNQAGATEDVILAMEGTDKLQKEILDSTQNLTKFSEENLSSLMQIKSTSEEITESSEQLFRSSSDSYSTIAEISSAAKAIAKSTEELSTSTEQITASIEQISANIKEVENSTQESASLTSAVREIASDRGMITVADAMGGMDEIIDSVDKTLEIVRNLTVKSKDVEKVLTVIADVTKQTNLLSVNAAILAAQAGEYGKGFSVVADEIKTLADRTASSAKEITDIIKAIQKGITEVTHVTENSKIIVENGNALVVRTGEAFNDVIESAQKSAEMANTIQKATAEQVKGITQIMESMEMIMQIVEHVTKATHEHEIGSEYLVNVAEKVKEVSEVIKRGMQEQTSGIHLISRNLELTNERIKHIADATSEHGKANKETLFAADKIRAICNNTLTIAQEISTSFNILYQEAVTLKRDMEGFKIE
jgi:methyl-accepting chemotaxis protein